MMSEAIKRALAAADTNDPESLDQLAKILARRGHLGFASFPPVFLAHDRVNDHVDDVVLCGNGPFDPNWYACLKNYHVVFGASLWTTSPDAIATARLYNVPDCIQVTKADIETNSTAPTIVESKPLVIGEDIPSEMRLYEVRLAFEPWSGVERYDQIGLGSAWLRVVANA